MTSIKHTFNALLVIFVYGIPTVWLLVTPQEPSCQKPLGMKSGEIKDRQITAPESGFYPGKEAYKARLDGPSGYCTPGIPGESEAFFDNVYIEVDLEYTRKITGFLLQGYASYGYGKYMQLWTSENGYYKIHRYKGSNMTHMPSFVKDKTQFLPIRPVFTSKLKLQLLRSSSIHCLRMEIIGCDDSKYANEYEECITTQDISLKDIYDDIKLVSDRIYSSEYLPFSKQNAWCLMASKEEEIGFSNTATIDLGKNYLIYGIQVNGIYFKPMDRTDPRDRHISKTFRLRYSVDGNHKAYLKGQESHFSIDFLKIKNLSIPLLARYIFLSMHLDSHERLTCIKLALYGCDAKLFSGLTTSTPVSAIRSTKPTTGLTTSTPVSAIRSTKPGTEELKTNDVYIYIIVGLSVVVLILISIIIVQALQKFRKKTSTQSNHSVGESCENGNLQSLIDTSTDINMVTLTTADSSYAPLNHEHRPPNYSELTPEGEEYEEPTAGSNYAPLNHEHRPPNYSGLTQEGEEYEEPKAGSNYAPLNHEHGPPNYSVVTPEGEEYEEPTAGSNYTPLNHEHRPPNYSVLTPEDTDYEGYMIAS